MVETYEARLVWIGRRPKDATIQAKLEALATLGPAPLYISADARDRTALERAYEEIKQHHARVHGLVHSVIVLEDDHALFLAGDTSYSQLLMLEEAVDGVAPDEQVSRQTLQRIHSYTQQVTTVYLPSHDLEARERLLHRQTILFPNHQG